MTRGAPVDLLFQSVAGTEAAIAVSALPVDVREAASRFSTIIASEMCLEGRKRHVFRDRAGKRALRSAHHGVDQLTLEARAYAVAARSIHSW